VPLPASLVDATLKATLAVAAGQAAPGVVSGPVAALTKGVLRTMLWTKIKIAVGCVLAAGALFAGGVLTHQALDAGQPEEGAQTRATQPEKAEPPAKSDKSADKLDAPKVEEKTYTFLMRDAPWATVFQWYADASGLTFTGSFKPTGTFTFAPPHGPAKKYTLEYITDVISEALLSQKCLLIRRDTTFTVLPGDEKIDPILVPRVRLDDLDKRGRTELVSVVLPVTGFKAKVIAPEFKQLLGTFGQIIVLESANQLVLQDTAGNLRQIQQMYKEMEERYAQAIKESQKIMEVEKQKWLDAQKKKNDPDKH
jgi:hypothetical protein